MSEVDLSRLNHRDRDMARFAIECGWRPVQVGNWGVDLFSPGETHRKIELRRDRNIERGKLPRVYQEIVKMGDPVKVQAALRSLNADQVEMAREPVLPIGAAPRTVVRTVPWVINPGTNSARESHAVLVRHWSDDTEDYLCRHPGCNKAGSSVDHIGRHYARKKDHPHFRVDEPRGGGQPRGPRQPHEPANPQPPVDHTEADLLLDKIRELVAPSIRERLARAERELAEARAAYEELKAKHAEKIEEFKVYYDLRPKIEEE